MRSIWFAAVIATAFLMGCTEAQAPVAQAPVVVASKCKAADLEWPAWMNRLQDRNQGVLMQSVTDEDRVRFLEVYNAMEPVSNKQPSRLYIFAHPQWTMVVVIGVDDDCVTLTLMMNPQEFNSLIAGSGFAI